MITQIGSQQLKTVQLFTSLKQSLKTFKGFNQKRWHTSNEVFPEKKFRYGYEKEQTYKTKDKREWYEAPVGSKNQKNFQTIDFRIYQQELEEAAQKRIEGKSLDQKVEKVIVEVDQVFGKEGAPKRFYDRVLQKELYFHHRPSQNYTEYSDRKISFLTQFQPSFEKIPELQETLNEIYSLAQKQEGGVSPLQRAGVDQEFIIEDDFYAQNPECKQLFEKISLKIDNLNYRLLPELGLALSFKLRYNKDVLGIWQKIEESFMKSIHHYPVTELVKMRYASCGLYPKSLSRQSLKAIQDIVLSELHNLPTLLDLIHALFAFRHIQQLSNYNLFLNEICKRPVNNLQEAIALLFVFSHSQFPNYKRKQYREKDQDLKEKYKIVDHLADALANNAKDISGDDVVRVLIGLNNLQLDTFKDVLHRLESYTLKNIDNLDAFQTAGAIYGFSKANNNQGFGSEALYKALEKRAEKLWDQFSNLDKAHAYYAFTSQDVLDQTFRKKYIQPWLAQNLESNLNHSELHYVAFSLMFESSKDPETWKKLVKNVSKSQYVVPVQNYFPLKLARVYLESAFPKWNLDVYKLACSEAEATWNVSRQVDSIIENNKEWQAIGNFLQNKLEISAVGLDNFENLLLIDWLVQPRRVAVMVQGKKQTLPSGKATHLHRLKLELLESKKFGVFNVVFSEFEKIPVDQKADYLKKNIDAVLAKQETYIKDEEEPKQWLKFLDNMQELSYRNVMIGEATRGGKLDHEVQEIKFDWSKLQNELQERQKEK